MIPFLTVRRCLFSDGCETTKVFFFFITLLLGFACAMFVYSIYENLSSMNLISNYRIHVLRGFSLDFPFFPAQRQLPNAKHVLILIHTLGVYCLTKPPLSQTLSFNFIICS